MGRISAEIGRVMRELERDLDSPVIVWLGLTLTCLHRSQMSSLALSFGGLSPDSDTAFFIRRDLFGTLPKPKEGVVHNGKRYLIDTVNESACRAYIRLECSDPNRKV